MKQHGKEGRTPPRSAEFWRDRAARSWAIAERHREPELRWKMRKIAEGYERLAHHEEMSRTAEELASRNPEAPRLRHGDIARYIAAVTGADMVSFQVAEPGGLRLSAAHGLDGRFSAFFDIVRHDDACACGAALKRQAQIVIPDIGASPIYARRQPLEELRVAGVAACVSTPILRSYDNAMQGIFSILKADVWKPAPGELDQLSALGKEVAIALANPFSPQAYVIRGLA